MDRDYKAQPLKHGEIIPFEDFYKVYIIDNLGSVSAAEVFNTTRQVIRRHIKLYGLSKSKEQISKSVSRTFKNKVDLIDYQQLYDVYINQHKNYHEVAKYFNVTEYRILYLLKYWNIVKSVEDIVKTSKKTWLEKLGVDNPNKLSETINKSKNTFKERCNVPLDAKRNLKTNTFRDYDKYPLKFRELIPKEDLEELYIKQNLFIEDVSKLLNVPLHKVKQCIRKYGLQKDKKTLKLLFKQRCAEETQAKCDRLMNKTKIMPTILKKRAETTKRCNKTKNENASPKRSPEEILIEKILLTRFKIVKTQEFSNEYPHFADFYIPETNLFIEYQGHISHGKLPFTIDNNKCLLQFNEWLNKAVKGKKTYKDYLKTWVINDRLKRLDAELNNLKWIEFFNLKEFLKWFKTIKNYTSFEQYENIVDILADYI